MKRLFLAGFLLTAALPLIPQAQAADSAAAANKAEHVRLTEEMKKLAQRNAWVAVEASYQKLLVLEQAGEKLAYDDHWLGAQAARDAGDATNWKKRLLAAQSVKQTDEVAASLQEVAANFGAVKITIDPRYEGERVLSRGAMPFAPDQVANVRFVAAKLKAGESYEGLLVNGAYTLDGHPLTVSGDQVATANLAREIKPFKTAIAGRMGIGPAILVSGPSDSSVVTTGFNTYGGRVGGGLDLALAPSFSVFGEVDYQGSLAGAVINNEPVAGVTNSGHLVSVWVGASYQLPVLWIGAGPVFAYTNVAVASETEAEAPAQPGDLTSTPQTSLYHGTGMVPGGALSLTIPFRGLKIGNLTGGLSVEGGAVMAGRVMGFGELGLRFGQDFGG